MATITEDYVSFECAKLLEEKGFEIDTNKDYWKIGSDGTKYFMCSIGAYTSDINNKYAYYRPADSYPCPTQAMAMKWLREVHKLGVFPSTYTNTKGSNTTHVYGTAIVNLNTYELMTSDCMARDTYEQACEAAIKYCLENLI